MHSTSSSTAKRMSSLPPPTRAHSREDDMRTIKAATLALGISVAFAALTTQQTVSAWPAPCDFLTGGGFIITTGGGTHEPAKGNFGIGGGCKHGSPTWGHLEYHDHGNGLNVHWETITAYLADGDGLGDTATDPKTKQPTGTRLRSEEHTSELQSLA